MRVLLVAALLVAAAYAAAECDPAAVRSPQCGQFGFCMEDAKSTLGGLCAQTHEVKDLKDRDGVFRKCSELGIEPGTQCNPGRSPVCEYCGSEVQENGVLSCQRLPFSGLGAANSFHFYQYEERIQYTPLCGRAPEACPTDIDLMQDGHPCAAVGAECAISQCDDTDHFASGIRSCVCSEDGVWACSPDVLCSGCPQKGFKADMTGKQCGAAQNGGSCPGSCDRNGGRYDCSCADGTWSCTPTDCGREARAAAPQEEQQLHVSKEQYFRNALGHLRKQRAALRESPADAPRAHAAARDIEACRDDITPVLPSDPDVPGFIPNYFHSSTFEQYTRGFVFSFFDLNTTHPNRYVRSSGNIHLSVILYKDVARTMQVGTAVGNGVLSIVRTEGFGVAEVLDGYIDWEFDLDAGVSWSDPLNPGAGTFSGSFTERVYYDDVLYMPVLDGPNAIFDQTFLSLWGANVDWDTFVPGESDDPTIGNDLRVRVDVCECETASDCVVRDQCVEYECIEGQCVEQCPVETPCVVDAPAGILGWCNNCTCEPNTTINRQPCNRSACSPFDVMVVVDVSDTISADDPANPQIIKDSIKSLVDSLDGLDIDVGIVSFATIAFADAPWTELLTAGAVDFLKDSAQNITFYRCSDGIFVDPLPAYSSTGVPTNICFTNWEGAFERYFLDYLLPKLFVPSPRDPLNAGDDIVIFLSDGNPSIYNERVQKGLGREPFGVISLQRGLTAANAVKSYGARIISVAVGDIILQSLISVSGAAGQVNKVANEDYYFIDNFDSLEQALLQIAFADLCGAVVPDGFCCNDTFCLDDGDIFPSDDCRLPRCDDFGDAPTYRCDVTWYEAEEGVPCEQGDNCDTDCPTDDTAGICRPSFALDFPCPLEPGTSTDGSGAASHDGAAAAGGSGGGGGASTGIAVAGAGAVAGVVVFGVAGLKYFSGRAAAGGSFSPSSDELGVDSSENDMLSSEQDGDDQI